MICLLLVVGGGPRFGRAGVGAWWLGAFVGLAICRCEFWCLSFVVRLPGVGFLLLVVGSLFWVGSISIVHPALLGVVSAI